MDIEQQAADAILDIGISIPVGIIRIPFTKWQVPLRLTMRRPPLGTLIRISREYLLTGTTYEKMKSFNKEQEMEFVSLHGRRISRMVALTICRGYLSGILLAPVLAFYLRWFTDIRILQAANLHFVSIMGTRDFMPIIRSGEVINPLRPRMSHKRKRS